MAISVQSWGKGADYKSSGYLYSDSLIAWADFAVGDVVIICGASDGSAIASAAFSRNNATWTINYATSIGATATNAGNVDARIVYLVVTQSVYNAAEATAAGSNLYVRTTGNSGEAKAAAFYHAKGLDSSPLDKNTGATGSSTTPSSGATAALSQADEIVIGAVGTEGPNDDTQGTWTAGAGYVSGNELWAGTNANGAAANVTISSAAEIVSATTAQTAAKTGITSRDWAACVATFKGAAAGPGPISESEDVTVTDDPAVAIGTLTQAKIDVINISDTPYASVISEQNEISKSESITVSDTPSFSSFLSISKSESITASDTIGRTLSNSASSSDNISVSATAHRYPDLIAVEDRSVVYVAEEGDKTIAKSETVTISDTPALKLSTLTISKFESVIVTDGPIASIIIADVESESLSISDIPIVGALGISKLVSDSVNVSDSPILEIILAIHESESVTVSTTPDLDVGALPSPEIDKSETVTISDSVQGQIGINLIVDETIAIADTPLLSMLAIEIQVSDSAVAADTAIVKGVTEIVASDSISASDDPSLALSSLTIQANEVINISDVAAGNIPLATSKAESITVTSQIGRYSELVMVLDTPYISVEAVGEDKNVSVDDSISVDEIIGASIQIDNAESESVNTSDSAEGSISISIYKSESVNVADNTVSVISIEGQVSDTVTVSDDPAQSIGAAAIAFESVSVADSANAWILLSVGVDDSIDISDTPYLEVTLAVTDSITIADTVIAEIPLAASTIDTIDVADTPEADITAESFINASAIETINVSDNVNLQEYENLSVSDSISISDAPNSEVDVRTDHVDSVAVTDAPSAEIYVDGYANDSIGVSDSTLQAIGLGLLESETITVSDDAVVESAYTISVSDSITVAGQIGHYSELISIADSVVVFVTEPSNEVNAASDDGITVSDNALARIVEASTSVADTITTSDIPIARIAEAAAVADGINITDTPEVQLIEVGALSIFRQETITVLDSVQPSIDLSTLIAEAITASDTPSLSLYAISISVSDGTIVTDLIGICANLNIDVDDVVGVVDGGVTTIWITLSTSDSIVLTEQIQVGLGDLGIASLDNVAIVEAINAFVTRGLFLAVADSITITESLALSRISMKLDVWLSDSAVYSINILDTPTNFLTVGDILIGGQTMESISGHNVTIADVLSGKVIIAEKTRN